jgi:hypothetical protein
MVIYEPAASFVWWNSKFRLLVLCSVNLYFHLCVSGIWNGNIMIITTTNIGSSCLSFLSYWYDDCQYNLWLCGYAWIPLIISVWVDHYNTTRLIYLYSHNNKRLMKAADIYKCIDVRLLMHIINFSMFSKDSLLTHHIIIIVIHGWKTKINYLYNFTILRLQCLSEPRTKSQNLNWLFGTSLFSINWIPWVSTATYAFIDLASVKYSKGNTWWI